MAILVSFVLPIAAQDVSRMDEFVRSWGNGGFMGAVLVAQDGDVMLSEGYGLANVEWEIPATASTRFRIASVTKQFTAAAILVLEEAGKLSVNDKVHEHWPEAPAQWQDVTVFHLLTHTSGIPESAVPSAGGDTRRPVGPSTPEQVIGRFLDRPLDFAPGTRWSYSNSGYLVLGFLIEKISGLSYASFVEQNIFAPLAMTDSGYDSYTTVISRRAMGYRRVGDGFLNAPYLDMSLPYAAGGLYSSVEDLLKWTRGLFGGELLSPASVARMTTPVMSEYGFGVVMSTDDAGRAFIYHTGGIPGFSSVLLYYPERRITVAALSNIEGGGPGAAGLTFARTLGRLAHGDVVPVSSPTR